MNLNFIKMKTNLKSILAFGAIAAFTFSLVAFTSPQIADDWEVPAKYKNMENPEAANAASASLIHAD